MKKQTKLIIGVFLALLFSPLLAKADTSKTFTETFNSKSRIEESVSQIFVDTKNKEATLPLRYSAQNLTPSLQGLAKTKITALASDGSQIMIAGANGGLNLLNSNGSTEDISGLLNEKAKSVAALDFAKENGWWLAGGEAKQRKDGALLFKLVPGGLRTEDLQADAKEIKMETVNEISCLATKCLLAGSPRKLALYDGSNLADLNLENLGLIEPIKIANNGVIWLVVGVKKNPPKSEKPYSPAAFVFDGQNFQAITLPDAQNSSASGSLDAAWNGDEWLIVRGNPFAVWQINGASAQDITTSFVLGKEKITLSPAVGASGKIWLIGGGSNRRGLLIKNQTLAADLSLSAPELKNISVTSIVANPWEAGAIIAGYNGGSPAIFKINLENYIASAAVESKIVASVGSNQIFKTARLDAEMETPTGASIDFMLSVKEDGWESFKSGEQREFANQGNSLKWRAVFSTADPLATPRLKKITISYATEIPQTQNQIKTQDAKRINDLRQVMAYLVKFKAHRRAYPIVDASDAAGRWQQLENLLKNEKIITANLPNDPLKSKNENQQYDYLVGSNGLRYLVMARLEDGENKSLAKDFDGAPLQILTNYSCDDPVYCQGDAPIIAPPPSETLPSGKVEMQMVRDSSGMVWHISNNKKVPLGATTIIEALGYKLASLKKVTQDWLNKYANTNLVKVSGTPDIYMINKQNEKRRIPTWQAFIDYGYKMANVADITAKELTAYTDAKLIKLKNDNKVWKLEGNVKRYIPNLDVFRAYSFDWNKIEIINWSEYVAYPEGAPLK